MVHLTRSVCDSTTSGSTKPHLSRCEALSHNVLKTELLHALETEQLHAARSRDSDRASRATDSMRQGNADKTKITTRRTRIPGNEWSIYLPPQIQIIWRPHHALRWPPRPEELLTLPETKSSIR